MARNIKREIREVIVTTTLLLLLFSTVGVIGVFSVPLGYKPFVIVWYLIASTGILLNYIESIRFILRRD